MCNWLPMKKKAEVTHSKICTRVSLLGVKGLTEDD